MKKIFALLLLLVAILASLASCDLLSTCTVTFCDLDGNVILSERVEKGTTVKAPAFDYDEAYTLEGWICNGDIFDANEITANKNMSLTPRFSVPVKYVMYGGVNNSDNPTRIYSDGEYPISLKVPTREGHTFMGWYAEKFGDEITSFAEYTVYAVWDKSITDGNELLPEEVAGIIDAYLKSNFSTLDEMFAHDFDSGYLDCITSADHSIYVNRYTGVMYYKNEVTGELVASNTYECNGKVTYAAASQLSVQYKSNSKGIGTYYSADQSAKYDQITVSEIENGLRVNYVIGSEGYLALLPHWIEVSDFEDAFLRPMFEYLYDYVKENLGETYAIDFFDESATYYKNGSWSEETIANEKLLHTMLIRAYDTAFKSKLDLYEKNMKAKGMYDNEKKAIVEEAYVIMEDIKFLVFSYTPFNTNYKSSYDKTVVPEAVFNGTSMYKIITETYSSMAVRAEIVKKYCPNYTFDQMYEHEERCNFEYIYEPQPVFECYIDYTFNSDGSFSVTLHENTVIYNDVDYTVVEFKYLNRFDENYITTDGHIFLPSEWQE